MNVWVLVQKCLGRTTYLFKEKALSADPVLVCETLWGDIWGLSQIVGTSDFYSPNLLSTHGLLFNTIGYLGRFSLQCPGLLNLFPGHVDIRGRWMWLTEWL